MEGFSTNTGALALDLDSAETASEPTAQGRSSAANRERAFSMAIEDGLRNLYGVIADFDAAFAQLMSLTDDLISGKVRLRAVVDVSAGYETDDAEDDGELNAGVRKLLDAFKRVAKERAAYRKLHPGPRSAAAHAQIVESIRALQIHPQQLRHLDDAIAALLGTANDAELALSREARSKKLAALPPSAGAWGKALQPLLAKAPKSARAVRIRHNLDVLRALEQRTGQPIAQFRVQAAALRDAHLKLERTKNEMIRAHMHMVHSTASKLVNRGVDYIDLVQEGAVGLMRGVERFDHRRGFRFATYAHWWIRQGMTRAIADQSRTVRMPVHMNEQLTRLRRVSASLMQKLGRDPTFEELSEAAGVPPEKAARVLSQHRPAVSLDEPVNDDNETTIGDLMADTNAVDPGAPSDERELKEALEQVLSKLTERERTVLKARFGVGTGERETLEVIGSSLGITRERTRQIEGQALRKLARLGRHLSLDAFLG
jgi:RNA polymerase primary sigma factor